jgi:hypothetical protein
MGLVAVLINRGLVESFYAAVLMALPTLRNKSFGAHGQGSAKIDVPRHVAALGLNLAASNIVFLVQRHQGQK